MFDCSISGCFGFSLAGSFHGKSKSLLNQIFVIKMAKGFLVSLLQNERSGFGYLVRHFVKFLVNLFFNVSILFYFPELCYVLVVFLLFLAPIGSLCP